MIFVFDTGILVRTTRRSNGPARALLERIESDSNHVLVVSPFILAEVGKALSYPRMQEALGITSDEIFAHVEYLRSIARIVDPIIRFPVVLSDPKDDHIVYAAVAAGADVLCTIDKHLLAPHVAAFCRRSGVKVMRDIALLRLLDSLPAHP